MKIISWNICNDNSFQYENLIYLLSKESPDVICLQEVTLETIKKIKNLEHFKQYEIKYCIDFEKNIIKQEKNTFCYLAILTKLRFTNHFTNLLHASPLKQSLAARHFGIKKPRYFQYVDIHAKNGKGQEIPVRIFNLHLEVSGGSTRRIKEFKEVLNLQNPKSVNIYCGDLNIFSRLWLNILIGWGFSFSLKDYFTNERRSFNRLFKNYKLINVFKKRITFPKFRLQLDHILVPSFINVINFHTSKQTLDSDHKYISVEISINKIKRDSIIGYNKKTINKFQTILSKVKKRGRIKL